MHEKRTEMDLPWILQFSNAKGSLWMFEIAIDRDAVKRVLFEHPSAICMQKFLIDQTNRTQQSNNMKSSLALLARRAAVVANRRGVASPAVATTFVRAAFSTQAAHDFESNMVSVE